MRSYLDTLSYWQLRHGDEMTDPADPADPVKFAAVMAEQEWRFRVRLGDELYEWLEQEAERRGYGKADLPVDIRGS